MLQVWIVHREGLDRTRRRTRTFKANRHPTGTTAPHPSGAVNGVLYVVSGRPGCGSADRSRALACSLVVAFAAVCFAAVELASGIAVVPALLGCVAEVELLLSMGGETGNPDTQQPHSIGHIDSVQQPLGRGIDE